MPPHLTFCRWTLILSFHLPRGFLSGVLPSSLSTKNLYAHLIPPNTCTCRAYLIFFFNVLTQVIFGEEYRPLSSLLCSLLHSPITSSLLGPNILLSTLFSYTLSLCTSLIVSDQVLHPYRQNYSSVYLNLYIFGQQTGRQNVLRQMITSIPWRKSAPNFFTNGILIH